MKVSEAIRNKLTATNRPPLILKEAQIIQGKITKIYPDQKAEIQIGNHQLIAEITASLSLGNRYFFEVQGLDETIHLKVIGEAGNAEATANLTALLNQIGVPQTKTNIALVEQLTQERIPFEPQKLRQAVQLLEKIGAKPQQIEIIKNMIAHKQPITIAAFQARQAHDTQDLGILLSNVMTKLKEADSLNDVSTRLLQQLENILIRPATSGTQLINQILSANNDKASTTMLFQLLQLIQADVDHEDAINKLSMKLNEPPIFPPSTYTKQATTIQNDGLQQDLEQLQQQSSAISNGAMKILEVFPGLKHGELTEDQMIFLKQMMKSELDGILPNKTISVFENLQMGNQQTKLYSFLDFVSSGTQVQRMTGTLISYIQNPQNQFVDLPIEEQFMMHLRNYLHTIGLEEEFVLKEKLEQLPRISRPEFMQQQSVKSLLLQLIGQESNVTRENIQPLLHLINGMQMQSVLESGNILQATLQLPSEKLGLHEDIYVQFEGQKNEKGQINPEYCRILFMLQLHHLEETVVDMHIQKRVVTLHVFNDYLKGSKISNQSLQEVLKEKLSQLNYQLSAVNWKSLHQEKDEMTKTNLKNHLHTKQSEERFDYRI